MRCLAESSSSIGSSERFLAVFTFQTRDGYHRASYSCPSSPHHDYGFSWKPVAGFEVSDQGNRLDKGAVRLIGIVNWPVVARSMIFCRMDVTYALDRYTVFEEQYNAGVELMKSVDLMYQTMLAELPALVRCYASRARP
ncbi:hypothetical protein ACQY74_000076 (plasmid) [Rhizobium leguminosarum bv. trifolii]